ncbi:MAG: hypothetical protein KJO95_06030 [Gammaproteobacteria bacterium]|nr:hypothetical protein [Woeseia sp.]MBT8102509.1 hypothetical protein [Gammaproteobacteria bacterium]
MSSLRLNPQITILLIGAGASCALADSAIDPKFAKEIQDAASKKSYQTVLEKAELACGPKLSAATNDLKSIEDRLASATAALQCEEQARYLAMAAAPFEARAGVDGLMDIRVENAAEAKAAVLSEKEYLGLKWGVGAGFSFSFDDAIDSAEIVNGVVRVSVEKQNQPRVFLEFHKYFWCNDGGIDGTRGCGPFVAVAATGDDVLSGVAMGLMWGWKVKEADSDGFSIGVGAVLDANVRDLADGFEDGQPPPQGETTVRYETKSRWSGVVFVTRTF